MGSLVAKSLLKERGCCPIKLLRTRHHGYRLPASTSCSARLGESNEAIENYWLQIPAVRWSDRVPLLGASQHCLCTGDDGRSLCLPTSLTEAPDTLCLLHPVGGNGGPTVVIFLSISYSCTITKFQPSFGSKLAKDCLRSSSLHTQIPHGKT